MALILRRTDISHAPAYEGREDYTVYDEDQPVGRIYRPTHPPIPGLATLTRWSRADGGSHLSAPCTRQSRA